MARNIFFIASILALLLALILAACTSGQPPVTPTATIESAALAPTATTAPPTAAPSQETPVVQALAPGCNVISQQPAPGPTQQSIFPPVNEADWAKGPEDAYVTITEYSDFQCPSCSELEPVLEQLHKDFPEDLRIVYRHFPLVTIHDKAVLGTQASEAAGRQGKFWEMHNLLFTTQNEWEAFTPDDFKTWVNERAEELDLDSEQFQSDFESEALVNLAQDAWEHGSSVGFPGTPMILFNGNYYSGPLSYSNISAIIRLMLLEKRQFPVCPPLEIDRSKQYIATLETAKGEIKVELFPEEAPLAVNNFVFLARNGWFDDITFHRVLSDYIVQSGDPTGTGFGSPGYAFDNEISPDLQFDRAGLLAMANAGPGSNGSQFFITLAPTPNLDGDYTIFGRVVEGMEVVKQLTPRNPDQSDLNLPPGDELISVTIEEK
jgi:cyclophilin family peptidyl-prolyl cis-trans isomerase/protein-disulfide isomerase